MNQERGRGAGSFVGSNVPAELKARAQWVVWQYEKRKDAARDGAEKLTKVPYVPLASSRNRASSTDPATWGQYGAAVAVYENCGYDGIGFVLSERDPVVGVDLDHCVDPQTGELLPWPGNMEDQPSAQEIVEKLGSYTEITPSGTGLRIFMTGELPPGRRRSGPIEMYSTGRFLTVTGRRLESSPSILGERSKEIAELHRRVFWKEYEKKTERASGGEQTEPYVMASQPAVGGNGHGDGHGHKLTDDAIIRIAMRASNGPLFRSLWSGNVAAYKSSSEADAALLGILVFYTQDYDQLDRLMRASGLARYKWLERADYRQRSINLALRGLEKRYGEGKRTQGTEEARAGAGPGASDNDDAEQESGTAKPFFASTDLGNAERLIYRHGVSLRFCHPWNKWLIWDGSRWKPDDTATVEQLAKDTVRGIYEEVARTIDDDERKALAKHARASESNTRLTAMVVRARSEAEVPVLPEELDRNPYLFNGRNGTLDLRTGDLYSFEQSDLITRVAPVTYDPEAYCPTWLKYLDKVMAGNKELISFLQRAVGYSLTGVTTEHCLFFLYGGGRNGKSTFIETLRAMVGDYGLRTPTESLMARQSGSIPNDIARLKGARFVSASEADEGKRLAEATIKELTGGDTITARFMRAEFFEFKPEFKLWFSSNHKPVIRGTDKGIWSRIRLVPFEVTISKQEMDEALPKKLLGELSGILNWALAGCMEWQRHGLGTPIEVEEATEQYRNEMDVLGSFIEDCCIVKDSARVTSKQFYTAYTRWCEDNGERHSSQTGVGLKLQERGFRAIKGTHGSRLWLGIGLLEETET